MIAVAFRPSVPPVHARQRAGRGARARRSSPQQVVAGESARLRLALRPIAARSALALSCAIAARLAVTARLTLPRPPRPWEGRPGRPAASPLRQRSGCPSAFDVTEQADFVGAQKAIAMPSRPLRPYGRYGAHSVGHFRQVVVVGRG